MTAAFTTWLSAALGWPCILHLQAWPVVAEVLKYGGQGFLVVPKGPNGLLPLEYARCSKYIVVSWPENIPDSLRSLGPRHMQYFLSLEIRRLRPFHLSVSGPIGPRAPVGLSTWGNSASGLRLWPGHASTPAGNCSHSYVQTLWCGKVSACGYMRS